MTSEAILDNTVKTLFEELTFPTDPKGLYEPLSYMISIGGKRIRPKLCLLTYSLFSDTLDSNILEPAAALEIFHSFTLIHDDIMDKSELRRGVPTVWKKWNGETAILSGDVMLIESYKRIAKVPVAVHNEVATLFSDTAARVCEGQQYDMEFENEPRVSMEDYEKMIGLKTAVLIACAAKMGALIARAEDKCCKALYDYGYLLGMAFQVADDYLDTFGDEKVFGKPIGGDIVNNKKSWLMIRAIDKAEGTALEKELDSAMKMDATNAALKAEKIARVTDIYRRLKVDEDAKAEVRRYSDLAMQAVQDLNLGSVRLEALRRFVESLVQRAR